MKKFLPALILTTLLSACCTDSLFTKEGYLNTSIKLSDCSIANEKVQFNSNPEGAQVVINGEVRGTTPCAIILDRDSTYNVLVKKDGFKDESFVLASTEADHFIKFGPLEDLGFYKDLTPNPVDAKFIKDADVKAEAPKADAAKPAASEQKK